MNSLLPFLTGSPEVTAFAGLILVIALLAYLAWYRPAAISVKKGLDEMSAALVKDPGNWSDAKQSVTKVLKSRPHLASSWLETQERVVEISVGGQPRAVMFGSPKDLWNSSALLSRRFNFGLSEAVPNILVGVGLFFTFVFLSWALVDTTAVLAQSNSTAKETEDAISELLMVAGGKFLTSLAGLLASILWTFQSKRLLKAVDAASDAFLISLAKLVPTNAGELMTLKQIDMAAEASSLNEELLSEAREQTGTLKRFETDLAVSLAGAINQAFSPQMEAMTNKMVAAIDGLSEKLGSMNQEALEKMLEDFAAMLKQGTESEMAQLQATLTDLSQKLEGAGVSLGKGAEGAANAINEAGAQLVSRVQEISENLARSATNLDTAAGSVKLAMNDLEVTMLEASNAGKRGALFVNEALDKAAMTVDNLGSLSEGLGDAARSLQGVSGKVAEVVDNVEELSSEQRAVVAAVRDVAPAALAAVERVTGVLELAANQTLGVMQQTKQSMESTAATLGKTVASITEGVTQYTDQIADLHRKMDGQLAKAVGSFDKGVNELSESVEELDEKLAEAVGSFGKGVTDLSASVKRLGEIMQLAKRN